MTPITQENSKTQFGENNQTQYVKRPPRFDENTILTQSEAKNLLPIIHKALELSKVSFPEGTKLEVTTLKDRAIFQITSSLEDEKKTKLLNRIQKSCKRYIQEKFMIQENVKGGRPVRHRLFQFFATEDGLLTKFSQFEGRKFDQILNFLNKFYQIKTSDSTEKKNN